MSSENLALDVSLEKARAMQRVWRDLYDGFCPKCHSYLSPAMRSVIENRHGDLECPQCHFTVKGTEVAAIETLVGHAIDEAVNVFEDWRESRKTGDVPCEVAADDDSVAKELASQKARRTTYFARRMAAVESRSLTRDSFMSSVAELAQAYLEVTSPTSGRPDTTFWDQLTEMTETHAKAWKWDYISRGQFVDAATSIMCVYATQIAEEAYKLFQKTSNKQSESIAGR